MTWRVWLGALALCVAAIATPAAAQAPRTYISGAGDDINPCSVSSYCKTLPGAISKTAAGGEIDVMASGGYGTLTIGKAITVIGVGAEVGIFTISGNAVTIAAGASDDVVLSGLVISGQGKGSTGIRINSARSVTITNSIIKDFHNNGGAAAISIDATAKTNVFISDSTLVNNDVGVIAQSGKTVLDRVRIVQNDKSAIRSVGSGTFIVVNSSIVTNNAGAGYESENGGQILSFRNNALFGNSPDGKPNKVLPPL
jgi:hypothetical protein